jgi:hypothetical protein
MFSEYFLNYFCFIPAPLLFMLTNIFFYSIIPNVKGDITMDNYENNNLNNQNTNYGQGYNPQQSVPYAQPANQNTQQSVPYAQPAYQNTQQNTPYAQPADPYNQNTQYSQYAQPNVQYGYQQNPPKQNDGKGIASMVLGIISLVCCGGAFAIPIVGLILGIISKKSKPVENGVATAGIIMCAIALGFAVVGLIMWICGAVALPGYVQSTGSYY